MSREPPRSVGRGVGRPPPPRRTALQQRDRRHSAANGASRRSRTGTHRPSRRAASSHWVPCGLPERPSAPRNRTAIEQQLGDLVSDLPTGVVHDWALPSQVRGEGGICLPPTPPSDAALGGGVGCGRETPLGGTTGRWPFRCAEAPSMRSAEPLHDGALIPRLNTQASGTLALSWLPKM